MGYIDVPPEPDEPINLTINPRGADKRMARRVWNNGDGLTSLVVFWRKKEVSKRTMLTRPEQQDMAPVGARSSGVLN